MVADVSCTNCYDRGHEAKDCTLNKADLELIGSIAAFIGARLQHPMPETSRRAGQSVSTIGVTQYKDKFGYVRIYCTLADRDLVQVKYLQAPLQSASPEPPKGFRDKCFRLDAYHYRNCYMEMIEIIPRLKLRIRAQADYNELLMDDVAEMKAQVDRLSRPDPNNHYDLLGGMRARYGAQDNEDLKARLSVLYDPPSLRDWVGDA
jgi:hypothetical protein